LVTTVDEFAVKSEAQLREAIVLTPVRRMNSPMSAKASRP
jgi:hypothetical protein